MYYYVHIQRLNGKHDYWELAYDLHNKGFGTSVDYFPGDDMLSPVVYPHLRFIDEGDAVAFCLAHGCTYSKHLPGKVDK